jgi:RNA polymerase sigma-70 factor, ECF subfamily
MTAQPAPEELVALLAGCARREKSAFTTLYQRSSAKLFGLALRILRNESRAEEILQDCYVSIWNNAASYVPTSGAPMAWMASIVRNRCLDQVRRPNLEQSVSQYADEDNDPGFNQFASNEPDPLDALASHSEAVALRQCLGQLEARHRQAIALAYYDGLSHSEIASHLREPLGTVKTWVRRGLTRLRDCLAT